MVQGSVVTGYEEETMLSGHRVTSVSTLTTELAQTHFQTTRSLWQNLTKALVLNVLPGPDHLCVNDPVALPVSVRPVSTCGLRAVCQNFFNWQGQLCAVCFSFKVSKGMSLCYRQQLPSFMDPCLVHCVPWGCVESRQSRMGALHGPLSIHWCRVPLLCLPQVLLSRKLWRMLNSHLFRVSTYQSRGWPVPQLFIRLAV